jgi:hypothetical protein
LQLRLLPSELVLLAAEGGGFILQRAPRRVQRASLFIRLRCCERKLRACGVVPKQRVRSRPRGGGCRQLQAGRQRRLRAGEGAVQASQRFRCQQRLRPSGNCSVLQREGAGCSCRGVDGAAASLFAARAE